jgi:hypothetical protein
LRPRSSHHALDQLTAQRQAEPAPTVAREDARVDLVEALEDALEPIARNARPGVEHLDLEPTPGTDIPQRQLDASRLGELHCVAHQVHEDLP